MTLNWKVYVAVLIITLTILGVGVFIGTELSLNVIDNVENKIKHLDSQMQSVELLLLADDDPLFCDIYMEKISDIEQENYVIGQKLEEMETQGYYNTELKKNYFELEMRDYLLSVKAKEQCDYHTPLIIYFYNNKNCTDCNEQGNELTTARDELSDRNQLIRTYTFDGGINESIVVSSLENKYNITSYPSLIIGNVTYNKLLTAEQILVKIAELD